MEQFRLGHTSGSGWREVADACLVQIGTPPVSANLGFLYVTDALAPDLARILDHFQSRTPVQH